ncbi:MAG: AAA family ATPase [Coleofasciculaceae cyanobacterium]
MLTVPGVEVKTRIYESANSLVYRAIRQSDNEPVILKILKENYPTPQELARYRTEYQITKSLNLTGCIKAYDLQPYQNTLVMFIEDFGGESLKIWLKQKKFSLEEFLRIAIATTESLGFLHAVNIIHKDINPSNIVFNPATGQLKLIDFGISTQFTRENPTLKNPNVLEGTLPYMSPEQTGRMNRSLDYRTDFYSLGITFYELLTHQLPFNSTDALELVHCHIAKQPLPPSEINPEISQILSVIVMKLIAKNAEERYQSAWGIKADLENGLNQLITTKNISIFPLASQDISDKFKIPQKLYGREREIETLLTAFERVSSQSELFLIAGYSGIGKSATVQELYKPITQKRGYFISGKFDQYQRNIPYSAVVSAFRELVKQLLAESEAQLKEWQHKLLTASGINGQVIIDVIPEVELIVGKQPAVPEVGISESQNRFNLVFQNFIKVFINPEHPLTVFLDDLQWADGASLKLMELLMSGTTPGLFLIGAYRDNEVSPAHPFSLTLEEIIKTGVGVNRIFLSPLDLSTVTQLISDTLNCGEEEVNPLTKLVFAKTGGNPFFMNEFIKSLYIERLLNFDLVDRKWQWNIEEIQKRDFTDNVVDLMVSKIQKLPENTQETLKIAACTGNQFELRSLASICQKSLQDTVESLHAAIAENLVVPLGNMGDVELAIAEKLPSTQSLEYKFVHDRIQQAAYSLIDEQDKPLVHRQIGQMLLQNTPDNKREEKIFDIVNQLNFAISLITEQSERDELAQLNFIAGKKAKASVAYQPAFNYLQTGIKLLAEKDGKLRPSDLSLELHQEATEAAYFCGNFMQMEVFTSWVINHAKTVLDKVKVIEVNIWALIAQQKPLEALKIGGQFLQELGVKLPTNPNNLTLLRELLESKWVLAGKRTEDLADLPPMRDPYKLAALRLLPTLMGSASMGMPQLMPIIAYKQVSLLVKYGNCAYSAPAYGMYGAILCGLLGEIERGYEFGELALQLLEQSHNQQFKAKVIHPIHDMIKHWKVPLKQILPSFLEAYKSGLESGDLEFAGYAAQTYCGYLYLAGCDLPRIKNEITTYRNEVVKLRQEQVAFQFQPFYQTVVNLLGESNRPCDLGEDDGDEQRIIFQFIEAEDQLACWIFYSYKMILCYLFEAHLEAADYAIKAKDHIEVAMGTLQYFYFHFLDSLIQIADYENASTKHQRQILRQTKINQKKIKKWAGYNQSIYLHKYNLVEAEVCRVQGKDAQAIDYYDRAISLAKEHEYIHEAALAYELAAKFYLSRGKELIARAYMQEARYYYQLWGAVAKVKDLETRYPQLFAITQPTNQEISTSISTTGNRSSSSLDIATVMKASEAISGEIVLDKLLSKLMKILIENVGAQIGYLILENQGKLVIEAECALDSEEVTVLQSLPIEKCQNLAESVISYVARTKEKVVLNDATCEGQFTNDPYIKNTQPKSILCAALMNQGQLSAIVYLENRLTAQAFTPERLEVLQLLSGQAAIAITNAKLYAEVKERESRLTQFIDAMPIGVAVHDTTGQITYANQTAHQLSGINTIPQANTEKFAEVCQLYQAGTNHLYPTPQLPHVRSLVGETVKVDDIELHQLDKIISLEVSSTPIVDETGKINYAIATFQDITERKQAEKLLADYNRTLEQQVAEQTLQLLDQNILQERNRMAREIHDTLAQSFTGIILHLGAIERDMETDSEQALSRMKIVSELAKNGLAEARRSVAALRPQLLEDSDLSNALNHIATQMSSYSETSTILQVIGTRYSLPVEVESNLLRIGQEAITNAFKYSKANKIQIELIYEAIQLILRVKDNGQGFDSESPCFSNGFGLLGMRERADRIGAKLTVNSQPGMGTEVVVSINRE